MDTMIYQLFLEKLMPLINKYFEEQKEFIKCKEGCANCCSAGNYPVSELEYTYMLEGYNQLEQSQKDEILKNTMDILKERQKFIQDKDIKEFRHKCPFLFDNKCCIYPYRALVCRTHGLILQDYESKISGVPHCVKEGLNYAEVCDKNFKLVSEKEIKAQGFKTLPKAYNLSYATLINLDNTVDFGDVRMLIEWIVISQPNAEELITEIKNSVK